MQYKKLGNSELVVSSLCLGTMTFGDGADKAMCKELYKLSRDKGINFFDCANVYADGESEKILGTSPGFYIDEEVFILIISSRRNRPLPFRPVAVFSAPVHVPQVFSSQGSSGTSSRAALMNSRSSGAITGDT